MKNSKRNFNTVCCQFLVVIVIFSGFMLSGIGNANSQDTPSVKDLINLLRLREAEVQDYRFIISRSFFSPAYSQEEAKKIAESETEMMLEEQSKVLLPVTDSTAQKMLFIQVLREATLASNEVSGNLLFFEGIGLTTWKYSICSFSNSSGEDEIRSLLDEESFTIPSSEKINELLNTEPTHDLTLKQVLVNYPEISMGTYPESAQSLNKNVFEPSNEVVVRLGDQYSQKRSMEFPFWHETFLDQVDSAELSMKAESEGRYRLFASIEATSTDKAKQYELVCDAEGNSYEIVYRVDNQIQWMGTYLQFLTIDNGNIRVPQVGKFWHPEYVFTLGPRAREVTETHTLLYGSANRGKSPSDLSVSLPGGSQVFDERKEGTHTSKKLSSELTIGPDITEYMLED